MWGGIMSTISSSRMAFLYPFLSSKGIAFVISNRLIAPARTGLLQTNQQVSFVFHCGKYSLKQL